MMVFQAVLLSIIVLLIAIPGVPLPLGIWALLLAVHLNFTQGDIPGTNLLNAMISIGLPTILLLRIGLKKTRIVWWKPLFALWGAFVLYVAVASIWSPFINEAVVQLGYLYSYSVSFVAFSFFYKTDKPTTYQVLVWSLFTILLIMLTGYSLGIGFYVDVGGYRRLNSFDAPQSLGLYTAVMLSLMLAFPRGMMKNDKIIRPALIATLFLALFLSGSRSGLIVGFSTIVGYLALKMISSRKANKWWVGVVLAGGASLMAAVLVVVSIRPVSISDVLAQSRSLQPVLVLVDPSLSIEDIGTARGRLNNYEVVLGELQRVSFGALVFGHGTSSARQLVLEKKIVLKQAEVEAANINANKIFHNEYLRVIYEWGIVGSFIFGALLLSLVFLGVFFVLTRPGVETFLILETVILVFVVFFGFNNIFSAASSPVGIALIVLLAHLTSLSQKKSADKNHSEDRSQ